MLRTVYISMTMEIPDTEQYPESYIMQRIIDNASIRNVEHFMSDFKVGISYLPKEEETR